MVEITERSKDEPTLIWSGEHQAWWRAPANGYTTDILAAGVYPYADAYANTSHCGPEKRIALQSAEKMLREHFFGLSQTDKASVFNTMRRSIDAVTTVAKVSEERLAQVYDKVVSARDTLRSSEDLFRDVVVRNAVSLLQEAKYGLGGRTNVAATIENAISTVLPEGTR